MFHRDVGDLPLRNLIPSGREHSNIYIRNIIPITTRIHLRVYFLKVSKLVCYQVFTILGFVNWFVSKYELYRALHVFFCLILTHAIFCCCICRIKAKAKTWDSLRFYVKSVLGEVIFFMTCIFSTTKVA